LINKLRKYFINKRTLNNIEESNRKLQEILKQDEEERLSKDREIYEIYYISLLIFI